MSQQIPRPAELWPLADKPFTRALLERYVESTNANRRWAGVKGSPELRPELSNSVAIAAGATAYEIANRAAMVVGVSPIAPWSPVSRDQLFVVVFGMLIVLGVVTECKLEGVEIDGKSVEPATAIAFFALHADEEKARITSEASPYVKEIVGQQSDYCPDLFKLSRLFIEHIPAQSIEIRVRFSDGTFADDLFGSMLRPLLGAVRS